MASNKSLMIASIAQPRRGSQPTRVEVVVRYATYSWLADYIGQLARDEIAAVDKRDLEDKIYVSEAMSAISKSTASLAQAAKKQSK